MSNLENNKIPTVKEYVDSLPKHIQKQLKNISCDQELIDNNIILSVRHLKKYFVMGKGKGKVKIKAVHDVSFDIKKGEVFGIVGESGCGKSTTGRNIIRLEDATSGSIYFNGYRVSAGSRWNDKEIKWTKIRGKKKIKQLKEDREAEIAQLTKQGAPDDTTIKMIHDKYDVLIKEVEQNIKETTKVQKAKIKQHNYDNKHVNKELLTKMQMIFQDPIDSLDPRMTVYDIICEGLKIQNFAKRQKESIEAKLNDDIEKIEASDVENKQEQIDKLKAQAQIDIQKSSDYKTMVEEVLNKVGLIPDYANRYPHEFSGGQRQRIGIARALIMNPQLVIADEPISGLDVSIRAQIINLLNDLRNQLGLTIVFIAHDLSVVKYFCDRIAVMYYGNLVELAPSDELFAHPLHPYTRSLLSAIPKPDPLSEKTRVRMHYDAATAHDYSTDKPTLQEIEPGHFILANKAEFEQYQKEIGIKVESKPEETSSSQYKSKYQDKDELKNRRRELAAKNFANKNSKNKDK
jgi:oligopeptide transport system ATP-binding protein